MNITVIRIGKLKEKYWTAAIDEYSKRLKGYCSLDIIELKEARLPDKAGPAEELAVKEAEGEEILRKIKDNQYVITLEVKGKMLSSEKLAEKIETLGIDGQSNVVFVIGGSLGLSPEVVARAQVKLSFSPMTFPHQLARIMLLEQTYRAMKIAAGERYHK